MRLLRRRHTEKRTFNTSPVMYQDAAGTAADLSVSPKGSKHNPLYSLTQLSIIKNDQTALATQLHCGWSQVGDSCLGNTLASDCAASKCHLCYRWV